MFCIDVEIDHLPDARKRQVSGRTGAGITSRAGHVTAAVDLDQTDAGVLLVVGAESAVKRTTVLDFSLDLATGSWAAEGVSVFEIRGIVFEQLFLRTVFRAELPEKNAATLLNDFRWYGRHALRAQTAGAFEYVVGFR